MTVWRAFSAWRRQRLPLLPFVGVALVVAAAARHITLTTTLTALLWVTAFRLWDDVASRDDDAHSHPGRVVVRGPRAPFARAALLLVVLAALQAFFVGALPGFVAVVVGLGIVYAVGSAPLKLLVLLKYPAMALLLSSSASPPSLWHLGVLVACFVVDDQLTGEAPMPLRSLPFIVTFICLVCLP